MPGDAHVFTTDILTLQFYTNPWPRIMDSAEKKGKVSTRSHKMDPVHGPPLQARVAAANGTVLAACKLLALTENKPPALLNDDDPGAHGNERGQRTMEQNGLVHAK